MVSREELVALFWGKAGRAAVPVVHPALFHMVDAGMVARCLVERAPGTALRGLFTVPGIAPSRVARAVGFLVALHDLGKISPGFQALRGDLCAPLKAHGYWFPTSAETDHARVTLEHLKKRVSGAGAHVARVLAAHHGHFHEFRRYGDEALGPGRWRDAREAAIAALAEVFEVAPAVLSPERLSPAAGMVLAGLTALADWLASDERWFPRCGQHCPPLPKYAERSYGFAAEAVAALGWDAWQAEKTTAGFSGLFPGKTPTALQRQAEEVARELSGPGLLIIEAPMGAGKTEAALAAADHCLRHFDHSGLYYALPTQATSNQMFGRVCEYLRRALPGSQLNVHLQHGLAAYVDQYDDLPGEWEPPEPTGIDAKEGTPAEREARLLAARWFRGQRRGLLAPFGVGTVDQGLLAVLQTPHMFLRLYGLAGRVVVIDEVHAYDTYTSTLLEELLRWLAALRSTVILLSATLPEARRHALLRAYAGDAASVSEAVSYPRITVATPAHPPRGHSIPSPAERSLRLERWDDRDAVGAEVARRLRSGGCAAWFCNTVRSAQHTYLQLNALPELRGRVRLIHAMFPVEDRRRLEAEVLRSFGRDGSRPSEVWVSTQLLEQSLDVDFDLMVSELAPIDLLLQRSGRLQRHFRPRPAGLDERRLLWLAPPPGSGLLPEWGDSGHVYAPYTLLRTWLLLRDGARDVRIPDDLDALIESVYGDPGVTIPDELQASAEVLRAALVDERSVEHSEAIYAVIPRPSSDDPYRQRQNLPDEDDPHTPAPRRALTRLGEPTITLICAEQSGDRLRLSADDARDPTHLPRNRKARRELEKALLLRSVRLQGQQWVSHFAVQPVPGNWSDSAGLRHCRLLPLTEGEYAGDGAPGRLWLHPRLGMIRHTDVLKALAGSAA